MDQFFKKLIRGGFYLIFLALPLIVYPGTSEIFEFNKIVFIYFMTIVLSGLWLMRMIVTEKIIFRKTSLDIFLVIFIASQVLSTLFSIDSHTSLFGYYSRFNGGLLSVISYATLYWIYVSNMDRNSTQRSVTFLFISTFLSSTWAIFEHFGHSFSCLIFPGFGTFDVSCWVQDVQNRVYSTFGQPNWLAAWLTAIIPLTLSVGIVTTLKLKQTGKKIPFMSTSTWIFLFTVFFSTLIFTKSRSGLLGFALEVPLFFLLIVWYLRKQKKLLKEELNVKNIIPVLIITFTVTVVVVAMFGTPWTPNLKGFFSKSPAPVAQPKVTGPALETGGTESGKIRQIVWKGAFDIWKHYPIFGSGVETFTFSYYKFRPVEHNLVSEWDYLYNKAHNEYLNYAATTGSVGFLAYLGLIAATILLIFKEFSPVLNTTAASDKKNFSDRRTQDFYNLERGSFAAASMAGYVSILITNFFGFSVVPISMMFFLFPAFVLSVSYLPEEGDEKNELTINQKSLLLLISIFTIWGLFWVIKYWNADKAYAKGKLLFDSGNYPESMKTLGELVKKVPSEPLYWEKLGDATTAMVRSYSKDNSNKELILQLTQTAIAESGRAVALSPADVNLKRNLSSNLVVLSVVDPNYLFLAKNTLEQATEQAPTDPKLFYNLSYTYLTAGDYDNAIINMKKAIDLKPNYERARFAIALMYEDTKQPQEAIDNLNYILEHINPNNLDAQKELKDINN